MEEADQIRFIFERETGFDQYKTFQDVKVLDISVSGFGINSSEILSVGDSVRISLYFKNMRIEVEGHVARAESDKSGEGKEEKNIYGIHLEESKEMKAFIKKYIASLSLDRLRECMTSLSLTDRYSREGEGVDIFNLLVSLFRDLEKFALSRSFSSLILQEVAWILQAQRASIFLIDPENNQLKAIADYGREGEKKINFDYRQGVAGSVFTTGSPVNLQAVSNKTGFSLDGGVKTVICFPFSNSVGKTIGVIEVVNKRKGERFKRSDEKIMHILSSLLGVIFAQYDLVIEASRVRRFSTPFDREYVMVGDSSSVLSMRRNIVKLKDLDNPILIEGESGVGKTLFAQILHTESRRGIHSQKILDCRSLKKEEIGQLFDSCKSLLLALGSGTLIIKNIEYFPLDAQGRLYDLLRKGSFEENNLCFDVRLVTLATEDLNKKVQRGEFHVGLFNFISKAYVQIPPLSHRLEDVESLINYFLKIECRNQGVLLKKFSPSLVEDIKYAEWNGNIGELRQFVTRSVVSNLKSHVIDRVDELVVPKFSKKSLFLREVPYLDRCGSSLKDRVALIERAMIENEIRRCRGNKSQAAREMGISREALRKKLLSSQSILNGFKDEIFQGKDQDQGKKAA